MHSEVWSPQRKLRNVWQPEKVQLRNLTHISISHSLTSCPCVSADLTEVISFYQLWPYFPTYVDDMQLVKKEFSNMEVNLIADPRERHFFLEHMKRQYHTSDRSLFCWQQIGDWEKHEICGSQLVFANSPFPYSFNPSSQLKSILGKPHPGGWEVESSSTSNTGRMKPNAFSL